MKINENAIEAAAKAEWEFHGPSNPGATWDTDSSDYVDYLWRGAERALKAAIPHMTAAARIEWGVRWDSKNTGPDGERPWRPIEKVDTQETAKAVVATAQRPWANPRVIKRTAPGEWETVNE